MAGSGILAVGAAELSIVLLLLIVVVVPIATVAFARSGKGYSEIGKGQFAVDFDEDAKAADHEELRQLVEAKAYRQLQRGEQPVDVDEEVERLISGDAAPEPDPDKPVAEDPFASDPEMAQIREEIRQVVVAVNERRERQGEPPLDVEAEVDRRLAEFG